MECFKFLIRNKKNEPQTPKSSSIFADREIGRSGCESNSTESVRKPSFPSMSQRPSNLRVFTVDELKSATKNFSRSVMLGEGGFGCVYMGIIRSPNDSSQKIEVAVKQLGKRGCRQGSSTMFAY